MIAYAQQAKKALGQGFVSALAYLAYELGWDPSWLFTHVYLESGFNPAAQNPYAAGLFQWTKSTIAGLVKNGTWPAGWTREKILKAGWEKQLWLARAYLRPYASRVQEVGDIRLMGFFPAALGSPDSAVLFAEDGDTDFPGAFRSKKLTVAQQSAATYAANAASDRDKSGALTAGEVRAQGRRAMARGLGEKYGAQAPAGEGGGAGVILLLLALAIGGVGVAYALR